MFKLDLEKAEETEIKLPITIGSLKKKQNTRKTSTSALLITPKPLTVFSSVQFSCSFVSDSLWSHRVQHARPLCPSPTPRVYSNSCSSHWWCHPTISSSVATFSSCPQSFPASGSFPTTQFFTSGGLSIRASASVFPVNIQGWFPLGLVGLISLLSKGLSRVFSSTTIWKHQFFGVQPSLWSNAHICTKIRLIMLFL